MTWPNFFAQEAEGKECGFPSPTPPSALDTPGLAGLAEICHLFAKRGVPRERKREARERENKSASQRFRQSPILNDTTFFAAVSFVSTAPCAPRLRRRHRFSSPQIIII